MEFQKWDYPVKPDNDKDFLEFQNKLGIPKINIKKLREKKLGIPKYFRIPKRDFRVKPENDKE